MLYQDSENDHPARTYSTTVRMSNDGVAELGIYRSGIRDQRSEWELNEELWFARACNFQTTEYDLIAKNYPIPAFSFLSFFWFKKCYSVLSIALEAAYGPKLTQFSLPFRLPIVNL